MKANRFIILFLLLVPLCLAAQQNYCIEILNHARRSLKNDSLEKALTKLQDLDMCDYKNILLSERQQLQTDIYLAVEKQKTAAIIAGEKADKSAKEANYNLAKLYEEKATNAFEKENYSEAWLYTLEALRLARNANRILPISNGRLFLKKMNPGNIASNTILKGNGIISNLKFISDRRLVAIETQRKYNPDNVSTLTILTQNNIDNSFNEIPIKRAFTNINGFALNNTYNVVVYSDSYMAIVDSITSKDLLRDEVSVRYIVLSQNDNDVVILKKNNELKIFKNFFDRKNRITIKFPSLSTADISTVVLSPDGNKMVVGYKSGRATLVSANNNQRQSNAAAQPEQVFAENKNAVSALSFNSEGDRVAIGRRNGVLQIEDLSSKKEYTGLSEINKPVTCIAFSPDEKIIASGDLQGNISIWSVQPDYRIQEIAIVPLYSFPVTDLVFSPDGKSLLSASSSDSTIKKIYFTAKFFDLPDIDIISQIVPAFPKSQSEVSKKLYDHSFSKLFYRLEQFSLSSTNAMESENATVKYFLHSTPYLAYFYESSFTKISNSPNQWIERYHAPDKKIEERKFTEISRDSSWIVLADSSATFHLRMPRKQGFSIQFKSGTKWNDIFSNFQFTETSYSLGPYFFQQIADSNWNVHFLNAKDSSHFSSYIIRKSRQDGWLNLFDGSVWKNFFYVQPWNIIKTPSAINWEGRQTTYSEISLNGRNNYLEVQPSEKISLTLNWSIDIVKQNKYYCPGCIIQIYVGMKDTFSQCIASSGMNPDFFNGLTGKVNITFTAPTRPGIYYITQELDLDYFCKVNLARHKNDITNAIAVIRVK